MHASAARAAALQTRIYHDALATGFSQGYLVSAAILVLAVIIVLAVIRIRRQDLSGADPMSEPAGDASSPNPAGGPGNPAGQTCPGRQSGSVALPRSGLGASRPRARARATASARVCVPSLAYRWPMWVLTVLCETYSSLPICRIDKLTASSSSAMPLY